MTRRRPNPKGPHASSPAPNAAAPSHAPATQDDLATAQGLILPGGKVDAAALERAIKSADEAGVDDAELRRVTFTLQRDLNKRLDKYLTDRITFMSRNQLQKLIDEGGVLVNARVPKSSTNLRQGDIVEVVVPPPPATEIQPENIPLEVLYEDEHLIVINKAPDIIVHPARSHLSGTMVNALAWHVRYNSPEAVRGASELSSVGKEFARPGVVHRLDRDTSGVIVFAKRDEAHWKLGHQFEHRQVEKRYLAFVHGLIEPPHDRIDFPLGPHPSREKGYREKYVVRHDEQGKPALTIFRVLERYGHAVTQSPTHEGTNDSQAWGWSSHAAAESRIEHAQAATTHPRFPQPAKGTKGLANHNLFSLVELELKTGRTHQIRVHLSHLGWPIIADDMYGGRALGIRSADPRAKSTKAPAGSPELIEFSAAAENPPLGFTPIIHRQALHAALLRFTHPITNKVMTFTAPLRGDMQALLTTLRALGPIDRPQTQGTMLNPDTLA